MESKNKVTIVFSRDDDDRGEVIAVFDDKKLLDEFLNRPLASLKGYDLLEKQVNPSFSNGTVPVWFVAIDPRQKKPYRIIQTIDFDEEIDAEEGNAKKLEGALCLSLFARDEKDAAEIGMKKMADLKTSGKWKNM